MIHIALISIQRIRRPRIVGKIGVWFCFMSLMSSSHAAAAAAKWLQSCPALCDPIDGSPPGSPAPRILQAGTLEGVAISFSSAHK